MRKWPLVFLLIPFVIIFSLGCGGGGGGGDGGTEPPPPDTTPASAFQVTDASSAALLPGGPDAIGGLGSGSGSDIGDYVLSNGIIDAVIDQVGTDPTSLGSAYPLTNGLAGRGGTLVDLAVSGADNDHFNQMSQAIVGGFTRFQSSTGGIYKPQGALVDTSADFISEGVLAGDTLHVFSGLNAGRSYRISVVVNPNTLGLYVPEGWPIEDDDTVPPGSIVYIITGHTSFGDNQVAYDTAALLDSTQTPATAPTGSQVRLRLTGGVRGFGSTIQGTKVNPANGRLTSGVSGPELEVETDYILGSGDSFVTVESRLTNPAGGVAIGPVRVADLIVTGGITQGDLEVFNSLTGSTAQGLDNPMFVPYTVFRGKDLPGVSYAVTDLESGQMRHYADGNILAVNEQEFKTVSLGAGETLTWRRRIYAGEGTSASDAMLTDMAASSSRIDQATGHSIPNPYDLVTTVTGQVTGPAEGMVLTARQLSPSLAFDPGPLLGYTSQAGFYPAASLFFGDVLPARVRPDPVTGLYSIKLPRGFAGLEGSGAGDLVAPVGLESGTSTSTYELVLQAPGREAQRVVFLAEEGPEVVDFDLRGQTGTVQVTVTDFGGSAVPARIIIKGGDFDGNGPGTATADPDLGSDPRAAGQGNTAYLLDGTGSFDLPPGAYYLLAGRGLEYSVARYPSEAGLLTVSAGQNISVAMSIGRLLDSASLPEGGSTLFASPLARHVSADLRVRSGRSTDSALPLEDLLVANLASGVEVLVSGDADRVTNLSATLAALDSSTSLDVASMMKVLPGVNSESMVSAYYPGLLEFPNGIGSFSAMGIVGDEDLRRDGAPADEYRTPAHLFDQFAAAGAQVIQLNSPRYPVWETPLPAIGFGFFTNGKASFAQPNTGAASLASGGYQTPLRTSATGDSSLEDLVAVRAGSTATYADFDTMELDEGNASIYDIAKLDWYTLTSAGLVRTSTASAGDDQLVDAPGYPRTWVYAAGDGSANLGSVTSNAFYSALLPQLEQSSPTINGVASIRSGAGANDGEVLCSSGPVVYVEVDADQDGTFEAQPGDLVADDGDNVVDVRVTVLAAPWVPVDTVNLVVNGYSAASPLTGLYGSQVLDLSASLINALFYTPHSRKLSDVVRMRKVQTVTLTASSDSWIIAEARGNAYPGDIFDIMAPGITTAVGWTNPVFVSTTADGDFDPNQVP